MDIGTLTQQLRSQAELEKGRNTALGFFLSATGSVNSVDMAGEDRLYVKYDFTYGSKWNIIHGVDKGISQIGIKSEGGEIVWNFPIEILFKSVNAHGWPRLVISVFGIDAFGRDVARGYGSIHIPTTAGCYTKKVRLFRPVSSSYLQKIISWLRGTQPEFYDSRFVAKSCDREMSRVESVGTVAIKMQVLTRGMKNEGYEGGTGLSAKEVIQVKKTLQENLIESK